MSIRPYIDTVSAGSGACGVIDFFVESLHELPPKATQNAVEKLLSNLTLARRGRAALPEAGNSLSEGVRESPCSSLQLLIQ